MIVMMMVVTMVLMMVVMKLMIMMLMTMTMMMTMVIATVMVIVMATVMVVMVMMTMLLFFSPLPQSKSPHSPNSAHSPLPRDGAGGKRKVRLVIGSSEHPIQKRGWYMASAARLDATNCWHRVAVSANAPPPRVTTSRAAPILRTRMPGCTRKAN